MKNSKVVMEIVIIISLLFALSYFLYGSTYRQYLPQFPGPLYQSACYQQGDPEAGAESGYRSF